jgi:hypothetical protein
MCSCFFVILNSAPRGSGWLATLAAIYIAAKQQSRRRYAANDFAFVPIRAVSPSLTRHRLGLSNEAPPSPASHPDSGPAKQRDTAPQKSIAQLDRIALCKSAH